MKCSNKYQQNPPQSKSKINHPRYLPDRPIYSLIPARDRPPNLKIPAEKSNRRKIKNTNRPSPSPQLSDKIFKTRSAFPSLQNASP